MRSNIIFLRAHSGEAIGSRLADSLVSNVCDLRETREKKLIAKSHETISNDSLAEMSNALLPFERFCCAAVAHAERREMTFFAPAEKIERK